MSVTCPYCGLNIELKGAKPGRFNPRCPRCHEKFVLVIPQEPDAQPEVIAMGTPDRTAIVPGMTAADTASGRSAIGATVAPPATQPPPAASQPTVAPATPTAAPTSQPAARHATGAPRRDQSVFASKRAKYADWEEDPTPTQTAGAGGAASELQARVRDDRPDPHDADVPPLPEKPGYRGPDLSGTLGGYAIERQLGHGGMGAVYLARQLSLDRNVALKVLLPQYSEDPQFVARFTREAYAAAQLTHHNVVQIHDIGADRETHYFSMEFVEGQNLAELVKKEGKQDPEVAVGYILQAARGLKFAHDHGMIHRDIKPDNLLINRQGIVKVADLGLVKTPGSQETMPEGGEVKKTLSPIRSRLSSHVTAANQVFGTPAYMAPEQCEDATRVDQRADIYSLGCTLYTLLTGRPPFHGKTAMEVMTKQVKEQVIPPDVISRHVPQELSSVVLRMMAKRPEDRYQDMGELIADLEALLGIDSHGPFTPQEEHVRTLEAAVDQFYESSTPKLRGQLIAGFYSLCLVGLIAASVMGSLPWASGFVGLALMTSFTYFVVTGLADRTFLFGKVRQLAFSTPIREWLKGFVAIAMLVAAIIILGWQWIWLSALILSVVLAVTFYAVVDKSVAKHRETPLRLTEQMLRKMRQRGLDEAAVRQFVCKYAGERWEEFYEALFGYEAKIEARKRWGKGDRGRQRKRFRAWRDPLIRWIDEKEAARKEERDRHHIQGVEVRAMEAAGVDMLEARRRARQRAERMIARASQVRESAQRLAATLAPTAAPPPEQAMLVQSIISDDEGKGDVRVKREHESYVTRRYGGPLDILLDSTVRFVLAAVILCGFLLWRYQNRDWERVVAELDVRAQRVDPVDLATSGAGRAIQTVREFDWNTLGSKRLWLPATPDFVLDLLSSWSAGVAGLILALSVFFRGRLFALTVLIAAAIALLGPQLGVTDVPIDQSRMSAEARQAVEALNITLDEAAERLQRAPWGATATSIAIASGLFVLSVVFLREKETI